MRMKQTTMQKGDGWAVSLMRTVSANLRGHAGSSVVTIVDFTNKRYDDGDVVDGTIHMNIPEQEQGMTEGDSLLHVSGAAMLQCFSIKAGLNRYGEAGKKACSKGLQQLHDMDTYEPMDPDKLTWLEKTKALVSLMFLVEKRNWLIKARAVADGSKQQKKEGLQKSGCYLSHHFK